MKKLDLVGQKFGKLTILGEAPGRRSPKGSALRFLSCRCDCGKEFDIRPSQLSRGQKSCGCDRKRAITHGHAKMGANSKTYRAWADMIRRCTSPKADAFPYYGGRGIKVCDRWRSDFAAFLADMGERPEGHSIERDDVHGDYEPGNCRWATHREQMRNKQNTRFFEVNGERICLQEAAEKLGIGHSAIINRIKRGWSVERAVTLPLQRKGTHGHVRGEAHPSSKLTADQVSDIRRRLSSGQWGIGRALAKEYGVSSAIISKIKLGQAWKD